MEIHDGGAWANGINRAISTTSIAINQLAFFHGTSTGYGGGLWAGGNIDLHISDCEILWCVADSGGGIYTSHGVSLIMERTKILHNVGRDKVKRAHSA